MLEWLKEPGFFGSHATVGADMSQLMATVFTGLFVIGWIQARRRRADAHHWMMLSGMIAMLAFFISYYLFRQLGVLGTFRSSVRYLISGASSLASFWR